MVIEIVIRKFFLKIFLTEMTGDALNIKARCLQARDILVCSYYVIEYVSLYPMTVPRKHFHFIANTKPVLTRIFHRSVNKLQDFEKSINSQRNGKRVKTKALSRHNLHKFEFNTFAYITHNPLCILQQCL